MACQPFIELSIMRYDPAYSCDCGFSCWKSRPYFSAGRRRRQIPPSMHDRRTFINKETTMNLKGILRSAAIIGAAGTLGLTPFAAHAQETLKIGLIAAFSGPFADYGKQME